ncbi:hypothetical protein C0993_003386 [Termitomyces sp. T159_Od127]|nr:hypothetical protein C0993_003386 [Termitomyces sp. T159_Od127]
MARTWSLVRGIDGLVPIALFSGLAYFAAHFTFGHLNKSGLGQSLQGACHPRHTDAQPYRLVYTGLHQVDELLCTLVAFFHAALDEPDALKALSYIVGAAAPFIAIPTIESCRAGRGMAISLPVILGLLSQVFTVGVTFPIYWLIFIVSGGAKIGRRRPEDAKITQAHAEAVVFGLIVGAAIPSVGMLVLSDPIVTAIWQPYPAYVSIAQVFHLLIRPASKHSTTGYKTIRLLYLSMFIVYSSIHIATIWPLFKDIDTLFRVYLPSFTIPDRTATAAVRVLHFLKWDVTFCFSSSILATLWFTNTMKEVLSLLAWNVIAIPLFGPGAAFAGVALWRESSLHKQVTNSKVAIKIKGT